MEILDFDPFALEAIYQDREPGPYDVIEPLPKAVNDWKNRLHPTTKKATKLVDISWQKNMGTIILDSFEFHVHGWTTFIFSLVAAIQDPCVSLFVYLFRTRAPRTDTHGTTAFEHSNERTPFPPCLFLFAPPLSP